MFALGRAQELLLILGKERAKFHKQKMLIIKIQKSFKNSIILEETTNRKAIFICDPRNPHKTSALTVFEMLQWYSAVHVIALTFGKRYLIMIVPL